MNIVGNILGIVSFVVFIFIFHWVNVIKVNSEEQLKQNKQIIDLLQQINRNLEK